MVFLGLEGFFFLVWIWGFLLFVVLLLLFLVYSE